MQMEKEIRELTKQRDLAESRIEDLLRMVGNEKNSRQVNNCLIIIAFHCMFSMMFQLLNLGFFSFRPVSVIILHRKQEICGTMTVQYQSQSPQVWLILII